MRKVFYLVAVIALAAVVMPSCQNKGKCWKAKLTVSYDSYDYENEGTQTIYTWGSEDEVNAVLAEWKEKMQKEYKDYNESKVKFTVEKYKASEEECEDKDNFTDIDKVSKYKSDKLDWDY